MAISEKNAVALSGVAAINGVALTGVSEIDGVTKGGGGGGGAPTITQLTTATKNTTGTTLTPALTGVAAGAKLVLSVACETDSTSTFAVTSSPSLTWSKTSPNGAAAHATSSGDVEIWTAAFTAGGSITVTATTGTNHASAVLYEVAGAETTLGGATQTGVNQTAANISITTTRADSLVFAATSDWGATTGTITYRGSPTPRLDHNVGGRYRGIHYTYSAPTAGGLTVGVSAPTSGSNEGTATLEIRKP